MDAASLQILNPSIGAGPDHSLVNLQSSYLGQGHHMVHMMRSCNQGIDLIQINLRSLAAYFAPSSAQIPSSFLTKIILQYLIGRKYCIFGSHF